MFVNLYQFSILTTYSDKTTTYRKSLDFKRAFYYAVFEEVVFVNVEIKVDSATLETRVEVHTNAMTDDIVELARKITEFIPTVLAGFRDDEAVVLDKNKVIRFFSANQKVFAVTRDGEYTVRLRLYELEQQLPTDFVRISNSEIINLKEVGGFDLSLSGTVCVKFLDGSVTYASRRYVSKIKQLLGM